MIVEATFAEIETDPDLPTLLEEYAAERGVAGMPAPKIEPETYRKLEAAGFLRIFAAKIDGRLIGFYFMVASNLPHYGGELMAVSESVFVAKAYRMSGAGVRLLRAAEDKAREIAAHGPLVTAPSGSGLAEVLPRMGYAEVGQVFFKGPCSRALVAPRASIPAMSSDVIDKVRQFESIVLEQPQTPIEINHLIHGGMYARTAFIPAGTAYTSVLIKASTTMVIQGSLLIYIGKDNPLKLSGQNILPCSAGRKVALVTETDVVATMMFRTDAKTVEEAEREFTDEWEHLASRRDNRNYVMITGD